MFDPPCDSDVIRNLIAWAESREDVRAMVLTSTRAVPGGRVDAFSDYDVIVAVTAVEPYFEDRGWLEHFGSVLVLYRDPLRDVDGGRRFACITQYDSGLKIDFTLMTPKALRRCVRGAELPPELDVGYDVLVDKDRITDGLAPPTLTAYVPEAPSEAEYLTLVEEFLHEATYVGKHLWRDDLLPAKYNLDHAMKQRDLRRMLEWRVELDNGWSMATRAYGKGLRSVLPADIWAALEDTYARADREENWNALFRTLSLFRRVAVEVGDELGFEYPEEMHRRVSEYLSEVRAL